MIQSVARQRLADFREDVRRNSYECSDKRWIAALFADLKYLYGTPHTHPDRPSGEKNVDVAKHKQVAELEAKWQRNRINQDVNAEGKVVVVALHAGADTIESILRQLETFIPDLPLELKKPEIKTLPPLFPFVPLGDVDRLVGEALERRGVQPNAQASAQSVSQ